MLVPNCAKDEQTRKKYCVISPDLEFSPKVSPNGVGLSLRPECSVQNVKVHYGRTPKCMTSLKSEEKYRTGSDSLSARGPVCKASGRDSDMKRNKMDPGISGYQQ
jgi:hypothetical protein